MSGKYAAYPEYRDSEVDWLGEVPAHWFSTKVKFGYDITLGKMLQKESKSFEDKLRPYLKAVNIQAYGVSLEQVGKMWFSPSDLRSLKLIDGDVLISEGGDVGRSAIWRNELPDCYIQNAINRARPKNNRSSRFLFYWMNMLKGSEYIDILCNKATIAHYTVEKVENSPLFIPGDDEADKIANFLDHETAKIDTLIEKQQQLIKLLKEKRQAVISHAVTKGLNPNAPLRDSGVEWLGEVPEHWGVRRINLLFSESSTRAKTEEELDFPVLSVSIHHGISDKELNQEELDRKVQRSEDRSLYKVVHKNFLAYNMMRAWQGGFGSSKLSGLVSPAYVVCQPKTTLNSYYFELALRTSNAVTELKRFSRGITDFRLRLYWGEFKNIEVPVPPKDEIEVILKSISGTNLIYNNLGRVAEQQIKLLKERRTALISAAVTGKIDVRHFYPESRQTPEFSNTNNKEVAA
ncbi:MAG: restriction endonuclease subunit S [Gammaproteobacteria bacterium]|nr:MAG: restriction endonuclease subunit S [Gammaproteobacteria bacterium]